MLLERLDLLRPAEIDVDARHLVLLTDLSQRRPKGLDPACPVLIRGHQKARPGYRREGHTDEKLGVVVDAGSLRGIGPAPVEYELSLAVALGIEGAGGDQPTVLPGDQRAGPPARSRAHHAGLLERGEPLPLEEGRLVPYERVPLVARQFGYTLEKLELRHLSRVYPAPPLAALPRQHVPVS